MGGVGAREILVLLVSLGLGGGIGAAIGARRARVAFGFLMGAVLGPIGWLILLIMPSNFPKCPFCKGDIVAGAIKCKNCGSELPK